MSDQHELIVVDDVVAFYPAAIRNAVEEYARNCAVDLLAVMNASREHQTICPTVWADLQAKEKVIRELAQELEVARADQTAKQSVIDELSGTLETLRSREAAKAS